MTFLEELGRAVREITAPRVTVHGENGASRRKRSEVEVIDHVNGVPIHGVDDSGRSVVKGNLLEFKWTVKKLPDNYDPNAIGADITVKTRFSGR